MMAKRVPFFDSAIERFEQVLKERGAVRQSGQRIVMGEVRYVLLAAAALGNVVEHGEEILRIAAVVADGDLARLDQPEAIGLPY